MRQFTPVAAALLLTLAGCQAVTVTKTGKGYYEPTKADDIQVLMTRPDTAYEEVATVSTSYWSPGSDATMHNALRSKCAPLGADAVVITSSGIDRGYAWTSGVAIRFKKK
jgi:hypothetical protein